MKVQWQVNLPGVSPTTLHEPQRELAGKPYIGFDTFGKVRWDRLTDDAMPARDLAGDVFGDLFRSPAPGSGCGA